MLAKQIITTIPQSIRTLRRHYVTFLNDALTFQQYRILSQASMGYSQSQMASNMQVSMAAISKMVDILVKKDLLEREAAEDRRCLKLKLTKLGEKTKKKVTGEMESLINKNFNKLTKKELAELEKGLVVLNKLMGIMNE